MYIIMYVYIYIYVHVNTIKHIYSCNAGKTMPFLPPIFQNGSPILTPRRGSGLDREVRNHLARFRCCFLGMEKIC